MERQYVSGFSYNNRGFVFGGLSAQGKYLNDLWIFDTITNVWSSGPSLPDSGRSGMASFVIDGKAYICGGKKENNIFLNEVWQLDLTKLTWERKADLPITAWRGSATAIHCMGYLIFGLDYSGNFHNKLFRYNPQEDSWFELSTFPGPGRGYAGFVNSGNNLFLAGGIDDSKKYYNDLWKFDTRLREWILLDTIPALSLKGGLCFADNRSIIYSTGIDLNNNRLKTAWKYIPEKKTSNYTLIFPNPSEEILYLNFNKFYSEPLFLEFYDTSGKFLFKEEVNDPGINYCVNVGRLKNGIYLLKIISGTNQELKKLMVIK